MSMASTRPSPSRTPPSRTTTAAIFNDAYGIELFSTTIVGNSSGVVTQNHGVTNLGATALQNAGANCATTNATLTDGGANFATDVTCSLGTQSRQGTTLNPTLGPLAKDPNGLTFFLKPTSVSPLLDAGISCSTLDQVGAARIGPCDIGAVEGGRRLVVLGGGGGVLSP